MTETQTDLSSESESFASTFSNNVKLVKHINHTESTLISSAARLELESITLKETITDVIKTFREEFPMGDIKPLKSQIDHIQQDLETLKFCNKVDQHGIQIVTEELQKMSGSIGYFLSQPLSNNIEVVNELHSVKRSMDESLSGVLHVVQNMQVLLQDITTRQRLLEEKLQAESEKHGKLEKKITAQGKDIKEMKQFLKLLIPRVVSMETSYSKLAWSVDHDAEKRRKLM
ncbi:hypothetical protein G210_1508 [Candida maltosa Xu316]|uniref:Uncharacterized protein n=1 Tax=Candida maltosa (strain Xu316) TaxID=1245528 RepID=M3HKT7_CANMX|nr:hypothetical protein G210_1508 [Candida maltosa Xu316]